MPIYNDENDKKINTIITIKNGWSDYEIRGIIKITEEQKILLDWLIDNGYVSSDYIFEEGVPETTDLTTE